MCSEGNTKGGYMERDFGFYLRKCRKNAGFSQWAAAEALGIYQSNISYWEHNISRPSFENLVELAELYQVTIDDLLGFTPFNPEN